MSNKERRFFSGDSLEAALLRAASHHQLTADELAYEVVEKKHGFLRARRGVVIEVDPDSPRRQAAPETPPEIPPATAEQPAEQPVERQETEEVEEAPIATADEHPEEAREEEAGDEPMVDEDPGLVSLPETPLPAIERYPPATGAGNPAPPATRHSGHRRQLGGLPGGLRQLPRDPTGAAPRSGTAGRGRGSPSWPAPHAGADGTR
jgi:hypothetical protein